MERGNRVLGSRKADLLRRSEQAHAVARTPDLAREVAGKEEPLCAALWFGGQLRRSLQRRDRDVAGPAKRCPVCRSIERLGDRLVRPGYGRGAVPDGAVRLVGECLGEGVMRAPKLV